MDERTCFPGRCFGLLLLLGALWPAPPARAQTPPIQCKQAPLYSLGSSIKAYDQFGMSTNSFDFSALPALLDGKITPLDPIMKASVGTRRVIAPELVERNVLIGDQILRLSPAQADAERCGQAVLSLNQLSASLTNPNYLCSLIELDNGCMTASEVQPHVLDPTLPKRALVALLLDGVSFCSGLLLDEKHLATARHCFIHRGTGRLLDPIRSVGLQDLRFESVDGQRAGVLPQSLLTPLELGRAFDITEDAIILTVNVTTQVNSTPLPIVKRVNLPTDSQALWVAGPVNDLRVALAAVAAPGLRGVWQDGFRWSKFLGAQCRTQAESSECIYHTCQTLIGFSGSPLITRAYQTSAGPVIEYAGLHAGTPGKNPRGFERCTVAQPGINVNELRGLNVGNHAR